MFRWGFKVQTPSEQTALVDTGASRSCIDVSVAQELGLPVINQEHAIGVGGVAVVDIYLATLAIRDLRLHRFGRFAGTRLIDAGLPYKERPRSRKDREVEATVYSEPRGSTRRPLLVAPFSC